MPETESGFQGDSMGKTIDVSMEVYSGMLVWPGDEGVVLERVKKMEEGAHDNFSRIRCGAHTGTHVDAPFHFIPGGKTIEQLPLDIFSGPAWTSEFPTDRIGRKDLDQAGIPPGTKRLLLKTRNSQRLESLKEFPDDYSGLDESGGRWILEKGIRLVGSDFLSVACHDQTDPVHRLLLGAGVVLVEGLILKNVPVGSCRFTCLPIKFRGSDGAPARAMVEVE
jgi:arylformamidase